LQKNKKEKLPSGSFSFLCGHILSYFELLPDNLIWQEAMENYIIGYHSSHLVQGRNSHLNIAM
jgi:hypothetical protein